MPFPDENVPSSEKLEKDYLIQFADAALSTYYLSGKEIRNGSSGIIGRSSRQDYNTYNDYANGRQDPAMYLKYIAPDESPISNFVNIKAEILPFISSDRRKVLGIVEKQRYFTTIDPIDSLAKDELDDTLAAIKAKIALREILKQSGAPDMAAQAPLAKDTPDEPEDMDGLAVSEMGARHRTSMELEQVVEMVFNANNFDKLRTEGYIPEAYDYGVTALKDERFGNSVSIRLCDMRNMIFSYCPGKTLKDLRYVGEVQFLPPHRIIAESNGQITKEEIKRVYNLGVFSSLGTTYGVDWGNYSNFETFYASGLVAVLDLEIYTVDRLTRQDYKDQLGNPKYGKTPKDPEEFAKRKADPNYSIDEWSVQQIYTIKWIIGSGVGKDKNNGGIAYNYGYLHNIKRDRSSMGTAIGSYHIGTCSLQDMRVQSRIDQDIPFSNEIQRAYLKVQQAIASAVPGGFELVLDKLEDLDLGGVSLTPKDLIDLYMSRGILLTRNIDLNGGSLTDTSPAIRKIEQSIGKDLIEFRQVIEYNRAMMKSIKGLNDLTDASTPDPKTLNGATGAAVAGTQNALSDLFNLDRELVKSLKRSVVIHAQNIIEDGGEKDFLAALGKGTIGVLRNIKDISNYVYQVYINDEPNDAQIAEFNARMQIAINAGQLTVADGLMIDNMRNQKQKEMFMVYRIKKNLEKQQQDQLQVQKMQGEMTNQSAQVASQLRLQEIQAENKAKADLAMLLHKMKMEELQLIQQTTWEKERIASTGRVVASGVQADGRDMANIRDNATALIKEGKGNDVPAIDVKADLAASHVLPFTSQANQDLPAPAAQFPFTDYDQENLEEGMTPGEEAEPQML